MAKTDFKALMLARGENFLLIGALSVSALLLVWGVLSGLGATDPTKGTKELEDKSKGLRASMARNEPTPPPTIVLPEYTPINAEVFDVAAAKPFDTTVYPDLRRDLPRVVPPVDSQVDFYLANVRKHSRDNFVFNEGGGLEDFTGLWITKLTDTKVSGRDAINAVKEGLPKPKRGNRRTVSQPPPPPPPPGGGGGEGGFGEGGPSLSGAGGILGRGQLSQTKTTEEVVEWRRLSEFEKDAKLVGVPAIGVFPVRMTVVQVAYPIEEQLKEIQRALRLPTLKDAIAESSPAALLAKDPVSGKIVPYASLLTGGGVASTLPGATPPFGGGGGGGGGMAIPPKGFGSGGGVGGGVDEVEGVGGGAAGGGAAGGGATVIPNVSAIAAPVFAGFEVQRRVIKPNEVGDWQPFDHSDRWYNEFTLYDAPLKPDLGYLPYFLRQDQGMSAPLPELAPHWTASPQLVPGEPQPDVKRRYPEDVRMPVIMADFEALKKLAPAVTKKTAEMLRKYDRNPTNPYAAGGSRTTVAPGGGGGGTDSEDGPGVASYGKMIGSPPGGVGNPPVLPPTGKEKSPLPVKHMLIRFLDTDLVPGASYQYRVRVKVRNPNFGKKELVADEKQAEEEFLFSPYFDVKQTVYVPREAYLYAYSAKEYETKVTKLIDDVTKDNPDKPEAKNVAPYLLRRLFELNEVRDGKRAVVQMQRWVPQAVFGGSEAENIGAWVQAELPVAVGEFIGRRTLVELPLWKSALGKHTLTPPTKKVVNRWPEGVASPNGRPVDFRTQHVLLDVEGGKTSASVNGLPVTDDAATQLLILRDDGQGRVTLEVRNELADAAAADRLERDKSWQEWIEAVRKQSAPKTTTKGFGDGRGGD